MKILAIETSCDETAIAIIEATGSVKKPSFKVLSNIISSQVKIHEKFGGVVPNLAKREHQKNLVPVLKKSLAQAQLLKLKPTSKQSDLVEEGSQLLEIFSHEPDVAQELIKFLKKYQWPDFQAIAFTVGPGLAPALWVGVNLARALSVLFNLPLIPVNHLKGHIYANWLNQKPSFNPLPAMALLISGGHTQLISVDQDHKFKIVGETRDDAVGEAYDKVAKFLGLEYPGGPIIEKLAESGDPKFFDLPRPMIKHKNCDFSFSGLKTAVLYTLRDLGLKPPYSLKIKRDISASFQQAVVDVLVFKTIKAIKESQNLPRTALCKFPRAVLGKFNIKSLIVGGGAIANQKIRQGLLESIKKELPKVKVYFPSQEVVTDNALMIAMAGYFDLKNQTVNWQTVKALPNLRVDE